MSRTTILVMLVWSACASPNAVGADHEAAELIDALRRQGMGGLALDYIGHLQKSPKAPADLKATLDFEAGATLLEMAKEAPTLDRMQKLLADADDRLAKFLKEHAGNALADEAKSMSADVSFERGKLSLRQAASAKEPQARAEQEAKARGQFDKLRPAYAAAYERLRKKLADMPKEEARPDDRGGRRRPSRSAAARPGEESRSGVLFELDQTAFQLAMLDYLVGESHSDTKELPRRKASFGRAAKSFNAIYQRNRGSEVGLYSHMWEGKVKETLGDYKTAQDIYEEVLVNAPDRKAGGDASGFDALFSQVEMFYLQTLARQKKDDQFLREARDWLDANKASRRLPYYQGIAFELAKVRVAAADAARPRNARLYDEPMRLLNDMAAISSEFQPEAIVLARKVQATLRGSSNEIATLAEAAAVGDSLLAEGKPKEAEAYFVRALALPAKSGEDELVQGVRFHLAYCQYAAGRSAEASTLAEDVARRHRTAKAAPAAGALSVSAALTALGAAKTAADRDAAFKRVDALAEYVVAQWPDRPEADEARLALGRSRLVRNDLAGAVAALDGLQPESDKIATARLLSGQASWRQCLIERQKPSGVRDDKAAGAYRERARQRTADSLAGLRKAAGLADPKRPPPAGPVSEAQLLLGEIQFDAGDAKGAAELLQPLVERLKADKIAVLDNFALRCLTTSLRADVAVGDLAHATKVQEVVLGVGGDAAPVNSVLVEFARLVFAEWKRADGAVVQAAAGADRKAEAAAVQLRERTAEVLGRLLVELGRRKEHSLANMIFMGETAGRINRPQLARETFESALRRAQEEPNFLPAQNGPQALARVKAQLVGLLRGERRYAEALAQIDDLMKSNPRSLELMMEKGRILQGWAETDSTARRYEDAVAHWSGVRQLLAKLAKKPTEYYEVVYSCASCLAATAKRTGDKEKAKQAAQLLKATLVLSPKLNGPDMVARYNALLASTAP